jgi:predicted metalloprotease
VSDRRGRGAGGLGKGVAIGGGGGIIGIIVLLIALFTGGDPSGFVPGAVQGDQSTGETSEELSARCNTAGAIDQYEDCFVIKVSNEIDEVWASEFQRRGAQWTDPELGLFTQAVNTGCGQASSQVGPFYCPPDQSVYIDLGFMDALQQQLGANGQYAKAYILAHEVGHHIQTLTGTEAQVRQQQQADPSRTNQLSVAMELQADCYAGVWSTLANQAGNLSIEESELDEALNAAAAVGDDRIQAQAGQRVNPETFTHGSAEQRRSWFLTGYKSGDLNACNTFDQLG